MAALLQATFLCAEDMRHLQCVSTLQAIVMLPCDKNEDEEVRCGADSHPLESPGQLRGCSCADLRMIVLCAEDK